MMKTVKIILLSFVLMVSSFSVAYAEEPSSTEEPTNEVEDSNEDSLVEINDDSQETDSDTLDEAENVSEEVPTSDGEEPQIEEQDEIELEDDETENRTIDLVGASGSVTEDGWVYKDDTYYSSYGWESGGVIISDYQGEAVKEITVPDSIDGKPVTVIDFKMKVENINPLKSSLESITFPSSLKMIGSDCFREYTNLKTLIFPNDSELEYIGSYAFWYTAIEKFVMPSKLKEIYGCPFYGDTVIKTITFNDVIEPFYQRVGVTDFKDSWSKEEHFNPTPSSKNITYIVPETCENYKMENGNLLSKDGTILYGHNSEFSTSYYEIPNGVKIIGYCALSNHDNFTTISIPNTVEQIEEYAFYSTNITSLTIPDSVTYIGGSVAESCKKLESVVIGDGIKELGNNNAQNIFNNCTSLKSVTLGKNVSVIANSTFAYTAITTIYLPDSVREINYGAFGKCSQLVSVTGGKNLEVIRNNAFLNTTSLKEFPISETSTNYKFISYTAFKNSSFSPNCPTNMEKDGTGNFIVYDAKIKMTGNVLYSEAFEVLNLVNQEREKQDAQALTMDKELMEAATQRAAEISIYYSHTRPDGEVAMSVSNTSAWGSVSGENIATGQTDATDVMTDWMNSPGHKANILNSSYTRIGIAAFKNNGTIYWVQVFGNGNGTTATQPTDTTSSFIVNIRNEERTPTFTIKQTSVAYRGSTTDLTVLCTNNEGVNNSLVDNSNITWESSDTSIATIDENGEVDCKKAGTTIITAKICGVYIVTYELTINLKKFTLTFDANEGKVSISERTLEDGSKFGELPTPTRTRYKFLGWFTSLTGGTQVYDTTVITQNTTIYAHWEISEYWIEFKVNGGEADFIGKSVSANGECGKLPTATKEGYDFLGWFTSLTGGTQVYSTTIITADTTLYAHWEAHKYTLTFGPNGGSVSMKSKTVPYGSKCGELPTPTKEGYSFVGWNTTGLSAYGTYYTSDTIMGASDVLVYAVWEASEYVLNFDANGGTVTEVNKKVKYNQNYGELPTPTREDYIFAGWYTEASGGKKVTSSTYMGASDITIYAHWESKYATLTFDARGGKVDSASKTVAKGDAYGELPIPVKQGYTFAGWYTNPNGYGKKVSSATLMESDTTIYADWDINSYTLTFDANGGSTTETSKSVYYGYVYGRMPTPSRTGYTFVGWFTDANDGTQVNNKTRMGSFDTTVYAHWQANECDLLLDANWGNIDGEDEIRKELHYGDAYGELPIPTRTGYTHVGWFSSDTNTAVSSTTIIRNDVERIYAKWQPNSYKLTFDSMGGSSVNSKYVTYDEQYGTLPVSTRTGYTFNGWFTKTSGGDRIYSTTRYTETQDMTLYAHWTKIQYMLKWDANGGVVYSLGKNLYYGDAYGDLPTPTRSGYTFNGWYTSASGGTQVTSSTTMGASDTTIYAHWTANTYTIVYNGNGSTGGSTVSSTHTYGTSKTLPANGYTRTGYTFKNWNRKADGSGTSYSNKASVSNLTTTNGATVTLYAQWSINSYTLKYEANGGSVSPTSKALTYGSTYGTLPTPTRSGYTFNGWYTSASGGTQVTSSTKMGTSNVTIYAHWTANSTPSQTKTIKMYRVYNPNSGEHFYTADESEKNTLVRVGWNYEGIGWTAPVTSSTPVYRLYSGTDHHYTMDSKERDNLIKAGWKYEGIGWYSDDNKGVPLYRQYNPYVDPTAATNNSGSHNYTKDKTENDNLVRVGWREEGIAWYGVKE